MRLDSLPPPAAVPPGLASAVLATEPETRVAGLDLVLELASGSDGPETRTDTRVSAFACDDSHRSPQSTPYGEQTAGPSARFTFTGLANENLGGASDSMLAATYRSYRPGLGRWTQRDPAGAVDGTNLFRSMRGNPLRYLDSSGLAVEVVGSMASEAAALLAEIRSNSARLPMLSRLLERIDGLPTGPVFDPRSGNISECGFQWRVDQSAQMAQHGYDPEDVPTHLGSLAGRNGVVDLILGSKRTLAGLSLDFGRTNRDPIQKGKRSDTTLFIGSIDVVERMKSEWGFSWFDSSSGVELSAIPRREFVRWVLLHEFTHAAFDLPPNVDSEPMSQYIDSHEIIPYLGLRNRK